MQLFYLIYDRPCLIVLPDWAKCMAALFAMPFIHTANILILKQITANRISVLVGLGYLALWENKHKIT